MSPLPECNPPQWHTDRHSQRSGPADGFLLVRPSSEPRGREVPLPARPGLPDSGPAPPFRPQHDPCSPGGKGEAGSSLKHSASPVLSSWRSPNPPDDVFRGAGTSTSDQCWPIPFLRWELLGVQHLPPANAVLSTRAPSPHETDIFTLLSVPSSPALAKHPLKRI